MRDERYPGFSSERISSSDDYASPPPAPPTGDYYYSLELFSKIQISLGGLKEAVSELKIDSKEHAKEVRNLAKEFHGYKTAVRWCIALLIGLAGLIGWLIDAYLKTQSPHT